MKEETAIRQWNGALEHAPAVAPIITPYQKIAGELGAAIMDAVVQIPGYADDLSGIRKNLRRPVTADFLGMTIAAIQASSELQGVNQLDVTDCRDTLQFSQAIQPLIDQLYSVARRLELIKRVREAKAGRGALSVYNIAKRVVSNPNNTHVVVHVENLRAELRRIRLGRPRKSPAPAPERGAALQKEPARRRLRDAQPAD
jgi:hypothetical protein